MQLRLELNLDKLADEHAGPVISITFSEDDHEVHISFHRSDFGSLEYSRYGSEPASKTQVCHCYKKKNRINYILNVLETERLALRKLSSDDAEFILELLNEPSFIRNIGDKGVRTTDDAVQYIQNGPVASYERFGFGLYLVQLKGSGVPIGICGLLKRETLQDIDVGFAFLPKFWSKGYAVESAGAVMDHGRHILGIGRIVAITAPENYGSIKVLEKIGLRFEGVIRLSEGEPEIKFFVSDI